MPFKKMFKTFSFEIKFSKYSNMLIYIGERNGRFFLNNFFLLSDRVDKDFDEMHQENVHLVIDF